MSLGLVASIMGIATFASAMIYSAIRDLLTMTVSDRLILLLLVAFPVLAPLSGWSFLQILLSMAVTLIAFFACLGFFAMGWMGGGDGKLITMGVLWVGADQAPNFFFGATLVGGIGALLLLLFRKLSLPRAWREKAWIERLHAKDMGLPYAIAIGIAGLIVLPGTPWAQLLL